MASQKKIELSTAESSRSLHEKARPDTWTAKESRGKRSVQVRMTRRLANWYQTEGEEWANFVQRTTRLSKLLWAAANISAWEDEVAAQWWRRAGHTAHTSAREPTRRMAVLLLWKSAWWRNTVRVLNLSTRPRTSKAATRPQTLGEMTVGRELGSTCRRRHRGKCGIGRCGTRPGVVERNTTGGRATHAMSTTPETQRLALRQHWN